MRNTMRSTMRSTMRTGTSKKHGWQGILATLWKQRISYLFIAPFMICFTLFIVIPIVVANALAFFSFNAISMPTFIGWDNFLAILTQDRIFLQNAIPNTFKFAIIVGPL